MYQKREILFGFRNGGLTAFAGTSAVEARGNEVNSYYLGLYGLLTGLGVIGLPGGGGQLVFNMVQKSAAVLHSRLLNTVMGAPLSFFSSTDIGTTTNR